MEDAALGEVEENWEYLQKHLYSPIRLERDQDQDQDQHQDEEQRNGHHRRIRDDTDTEEVRDENHYPDGVSTADEVGSGTSNHSSWPEMHSLTDSPGYQPSRPPSLPSPSIIACSPDVIPMESNPPLPGSALIQNGVEAPAAAASSPSRKLKLASRLNALAQRLMDGEDDSLDEPSLAAQVERLENALLDRATPASPPPQSHRAHASHASQAKLKAAQSSPTHADSPVHSSSSPAEVRSDRSKESQSKPAATGEEHVTTKNRLTLPQARKIITEAAKLNDELNIAVINLRARQEESDHIHALLIERAERAAQRILFLQRHIAYMEQELRENDDELLHLRICLKAVEIQMPPPGPHHHLDSELQRGIAAFREDYYALRRRRAARQRSGPGGGFTEGNPQSPPRPPTPATQPEPTAPAQPPR